MPVKGKVEAITPERARELLAGNRRNRRVREAQVRAFAAAMRQDRWDLNGETVKIGDDGTVIDGQHRLLAVCDAARTVPMVVVTGLPVTVQETVDTGRRRKLSDVLAIANYPDSAALATAINALYRYRVSGTFDPARSPSSREALELVASRPDLVRSVRIARRVTKEIGGPVGVFAACHHLFSELDASAADEFFDHLARGHDLRENDPIRHLRRHLVRTRADRAYAKRPEHIGALTFKAFNLWRRGASVELLTFKARGRWPETFPVLDASPLVEARS